MINALIIDDEEDARVSLRIAVERYCPEIVIRQVCATPEEGISAIKTLMPDLVFLDIQMPAMSGFDVLERVAPVTFAVIFVSSYDKYAIKAISFSALDYLLKPVDVDELVHAVQKVLARQAPAIAASQYQSILNNIRQRPDAITRLAVPSSDGIDFFNVEEVIFCKAEGSYTCVFLTGRRKELVSKNLKDFENILSGSGFCRVHHSFLINLKHVHRYVKGEGGHVTLTEGHVADISRRKKEEFINLINKV